MVKLVAAAEPAPVVREAASVAKLAAADSGRRMAPVRPEAAPVGKLAVAKARPVAKLVMREAAAVATKLAELAVANVDVASPVANEVAVLDGALVRRGCGKILAEGPGTTAPVGLSVQVYELCAW